MVSLTEGQKAALSPEAIAFLSNTRQPPFADMIAPFVTAPSRVPKLRQAQETTMAAGEAALIAQHKLQIRETTIAGVTVYIIEPPVLQSDRVLFNIHGGGFVLGSAKDRGALTMAAEMGVRVFSPAYTKAPEARYPVARDQCLRVYQALLRGEFAGSEGPVNTTELYAMGSSSGAQILVSMLLVAQVRSLPMPLAGIYLCTPAVDLSGAGDSVVVNGHDRDIVTASLLMNMMKQNYPPTEGIELTDPMYSPLYANYDAAFPRTVITVGTRDLMFSSGVRFYWKLREAGVEVELLVFEGMWHGFNWDPVVPEALRARRAVIEFLREGKTT